MQIKIIYFEKNFNLKVFYLLKNILYENEIILLSGGKSIKKILKSIKKKIFIPQKKTIILSDERLYKNNNDNRTNYANLKKNFFKFFSFKKLKFIYFLLGSNNCILVKNFQKKIENIVPNIALLSLGNDGHICSIFTKSKKLYCSSYLDIVKPINRTKRVTLNMKFLKNIDQILLIVSGKQKGVIFNKILSKKKTLFPFTKFNKISFILDKGAYREIKIVNKFKLKIIDNN